MGIKKKLSENLSDFTIPKNDTLFTYLRCLTVFSGDHMTPR